MRGELFQGADSFTWPTSPKVGAVCGTRSSRTMNSRTPCKKKRHDVYIISEYCLCDENILFGGLLSGMWMTRMNFSMRAPYRPR